MTEYIIEVETKRYGWCLLVLAGTTLDRAKEVLKHCEEGTHGLDWCRKEYKDNKFRIKEVNSDECWWNYGTN